MTRHGSARCACNHKKYDKAIFHILNALQNGFLIPKDHAQEIWNEIEGKPTRPAGGKNGGRRLK